MLPYQTFLGSARTVAVVLPIDQMPTDDAASARAPERTRIMVPEPSRLRLAIVSSLSESQLGRPPDMKFSRMEIVMTSLTDLVKGSVMSDSSSANRVSALATIPREGLNSNEVMYLSNLIPSMALASDAAVIKSSSPAKTTSSQKTLSIV